VVDFAKKVLTTETHQRTRVFVGSHTGSWSRNEVFAGGSCAGYVCDSDRVVRLATHPQKIRVFIRGPMFIARVSHGLLHPDRLLRFSGKFIFISAAVAALLRIRHRHGEPGQPGREAGVSARPGFRHGLVVLLSRRFRAQDYDPVSARFGMWVDVGLSSSV
jgi:hypothetical protein